MSTSRTLACLGSCAALACGRPSGSSGPALSSSAPPSSSRASGGAAASDAGGCSTEWPTSLAITPSSGVRFDDPAAKDFDTIQKRAVGWHPPPSLHLEVEPPVASATTVTVAAVLSNTGTSLIEMYTLAGGIPGFSTNPWNARLNVPERPRPPLDPRPPEVYPFAQITVLPPKASVRYVLTICRAAYVTAPGQTVGIDWSFELWTDRRTGQTSVKLP
jgi:hypothetical protein